MEEKTFTLEEILSEEKGNSIGESLNTPMVANDWQPINIQKNSREYHIVSDGILTKKDYALLFLNEEEQHHIPVEVVEQINFYSNVGIASNVLNTLNELLNGDDFS